MILIPMIVLIIIGVTTAMTDSYAMRLARAARAAAAEVAE